MKLAKLGTGPEIFHTLQGEGVSAGCPAVFIRTSRCNLHCVWCDTDHTWNFEGTPWHHQNDSRPGYRKFNKSEVTIDCSPAEAAAEILSHGCPRVVITGGEPLLQQDELIDMIREIRREMPSCVFELETNGTQIPTPEILDEIDQFNISPKLSNSGMPENLRIQESALRCLAKSPKAWFKFVVTAAEDLIEIQTLRSRFQIPADRILLMPEGRSHEALNQHADWLAQTCKHLGFRFSDRLHVRLWGDQRGV